MITFIRCSDADADVSRRAVKRVSEESKARRGNISDMASVALVYALGLFMVILQLRSIL